MEMPWKYRVEQEKEVKQGLDYAEVHPKASDTVNLRTSRAKSF